jgi:uncharacterized protein (TIGR00290 family)
MGTKESSINKESVYFNWSSGKDSSLALYDVLRANRFKVDKLLTSIGKETQRVSMHGLHKKALLKQCEAIGIPLELVELPQQTDHESYGKIMEEQVRRLYQEGYRKCFFGDIFLEDLRAYREEQLAKVGMKAHFPLWKRDTSALMNDFLEAGFKAVIVAANAKWFDQTTVGTTITKEWVAALPNEVDPCGENGEFHTFCYAGPIFKKALNIEVGEKVSRFYENPENKAEKVQFWYSDIIVNS